MSLKACPFCNTVSASIIKIGENHAVRCSKCGATSGTAYTKELATDLWNWRTEKSDLDSFRDMLNKSEFSNYFTEEDNNIIRGEENVETKDVKFIQTKSGICVTGVFLKSTEELLGFLLEAKDANDK